MLSEAATYMIAMMVSLILWSLYIGLFSTGSLCVTLVKLGFVTYPDGPETYFYLYDSRGMDNKWWLAADFWSISATMASDIFMFWRVYIVWSGDKRVIYFPVLLVVIVGVGRIMILAFNIMYSQRFADPVFVAQDNALNLAVRWTALADTWYSTGFICFRLWSMERRKRGVGAASHEDFWTDLTDHYGKIARVLIQSGMLYSATYVAFIMCLTLENRGGANIINFMNVRIIGIAVTLIIHQSNTKVPTTKHSHNTLHPNSMGYSMPVFNHGSRTAGTRDLTSFADVGAPPDVDTNQVKSNSPFSIHSSGSNLHAFVTYSLCVSPRTPLFGSPLYEKCVNLSFNAGGAVLSSCSRPRILHVNGTKGSASWDSPSTKGVSYG